MFLTLMAMGLASLATARAQDSSKAYCMQLSDLYRRYVQNATGRRVDVEVLVALDDCTKGNAAAAIPVLEKRLRDAKITPPGGGEFRP